MMAVMLFVTASPNAHAKSDASIRLEFGEEAASREKLAKKLVKILRDPQVATKGFVNDPQLLNSNDGNSFGSNTAYHDYKWDYCLNWIDRSSCEKWLDPYVSLHGLEGGADKSPLETFIGQKWLQSGRYGLWDISARDEGGPERRFYKRTSLDPEKVADWRLKQDVQTEVEKIGTQTADKAIRQANEGNDQSDEQVMPNMESLRTMAAAWTRTLRNRLVANLGEARAAQEGIAFELGEDRVDCSIYENEFKDLEVQGGTPGVVDLYARKPTTIINESQNKRKQLCEQVRQFSVYDVNPLANDKGEVQLGSPEREAYDRAANRINIAMIDYVGLDPNTMPKPDGVDYGDYSSELINYQDGGADYETYKATNAQQIRDYNRALAQAKENLKGIEARAPEFAGNFDDPTKFQINMMETDLVSINGLSEQMKDELKDTSAKDSTIYKQTGPFSTNPEENLEQTPTELTIIPIGN